MISTIILKAKPLPDMKGKNIVLGTKNAINGVINKPANILYIRIFFVIFILSSIANRNYGR